MRKTILVLLNLILISINSNSQQHKLNQLKGNWNISGEENSGVSLEIIDSATIFLTYQGEKKQIRNLNADFSKSPAWLDFNITVSNETIQIKSLLYIIGEKIIKWQLFLEEERPAFFSSTKGELLYLKKDDVKSKAIVASN